MTNLKLGKRPYEPDPRTLKLARYVDRLLLPPVPECYDWTARWTAPWGMFLNDSIVDCTVAAAAHMIMLWTALAGAGMAVPTDPQVLTAYEAISGYKPGDPGSDAGAFEVAVLRYWRATGIGGHKIGAFGALEPGNWSHVSLGLWLFGGLYTGLLLPVTAQDQVGKVWDVVGDGQTGDSAPGSWGGHAVPAVAFSPYDVTVVTWGAKQVMTRAFYETYCDETWGIVSQDWIDKAGLAPSGFDVAQLVADLAAIT